MIRRMLVVCAIVLGLPVAAHAQGMVTNAFGIRVGVSSGPSSMDQLMVGGQLEISGVAPDVTFIPNLELGFGDHTTTIQLNGDFHYHFDVSGSAWKPYAGAGLGVAFYSFDVPAGFDDSATEVGLNIIGGAIVPTRSGNRFFAEIKLGIGDIPDLKALVGWNFKM